MADLIFDIAAWKAANSLRGIQKGNQTNAENGRIQALAGALSTVTDPAMRTQIESVLRQELDKIDGVKQEEQTKSQAKRAALVLSAIIIFIAIAHAGPGKPEKTIRNPSATTSIEATPTPVTPP